ncbi:hypothetical protein TPSD3_08355 [Thioflexithrix psekupsensis]|uniref:Uncharacterized protein n=1 Tax=Thioflexithrix psekupsensis TaxID=1570016 RepID=A0A251X9H2_9GAMM|nr:hypothetical protein TPSD3_08355 [Thioflexithrix psekupsensis]
MILKQLIDFQINHIFATALLGSHGKYFQDRTSTKNIQFPYGSYSGHFCLGIIYNRADEGVIDETQKYTVGELHSIASVVRDFQFFAVEKWKIASDKSR